MATTTTETTIIQPLFNISYVNTPGAWCHGSSVINCVGIELILGIFVMVTFFLAAYKGNIPTNFLTIILSLTEGAAFGAIAAGVALPYLETLLSIAASLMAALIVASVFMWHRLNLLCFGPFVVASYAFAISHVYVGMNTRNDLWYIDFIQKFGIVLITILTIILAILDHFNWVLPNYSTHVELISIKSSLRSPLLAERACQKLHLQKQVLLDICKNVLNQSNVDAKLYKLFTGDVSYDAILTALSISCLKISSSFKNETVMQRLKSLNKGHLHGTAMPHLDIIFIDKEENIKYERLDYKTISFTTNELPLAEEVRIATNMFHHFQYVFLKSLPKNDLTMDELDAKFRGYCFTTETSPSSNYGIDNYQKLMGRKCNISRFINPYGVNANGWHHQIKGCKYANTNGIDGFGEIDELPFMLKGSIQIVNIMKAKTVTNFLNFSAFCHHDPSVDEFIVSENEVETSSSITVELALAINATRLRLTITDEASNYIIDKLESLVAH